MIKNILESDELPEYLKFIFTIMIMGTILFVMYSVIDYSNNIREIKQEAIQKCALERPEIDPEYIDIKMKYNYLTKKVIWIECYELTEEQVLKNRIDENRWIIN